MMNARISAFNAFKDVANDIYIKMDRINSIKTFDEIIAFTVNASLACELGLKAIIAEKYEYPHCHDLKQLFNKLDTTIQLFIKSNMPSLIDKSDQSIEFDQLITTVSENFIHWRYFYEGNVQTNWQFLYELVNSIALYFDNHSFLDYLKTK